MRLAPTREKLCVAWIEGINKAERTEPRDGLPHGIVADWQIHLRVSPPHP